LVWIAILEFAGEVVRVGLHIEMAVAGQIEQDRARFSFFLTLKCFVDDLGCAHPALPLRPFEVAKGCSTFKREIKVFKFQSAFTDGHEIEIWGVIFGPLSKCGNYISR
jgi:hypothetical protein